MTIEEIIREKTADSLERRLIESKVRKAMNVSQRHFYRLKKGSVKLTVDKAARAAKALQVPVSKLAAAALIFLMAISCKPEEPKPAHFGIIDGVCYDTITFKHTPFPILVPGPCPKESHDPRFEPNL